MFTATFRPVWQTLKSLSIKRRLIFWRVLRFSADLLALEAGLGHVEDLLRVPGVAAAAEQLQRTRRLDRLFPARFGLRVLLRFPSLPWKDHSGLGWSAQDPDIQIRDPSPDVLFKEGEGGQLQREGVVLFRHAEGQVVGYLEKFEEVDFDEWNS